jgi:hypothetical protein
MAKLAVWIAAISGGRFAALNVTQVFYCHPSPENPGIR